MTGVYQIMRCPNYAGHLAAWMAHFVIGWPYKTPVQWAMATFGLVTITYVMVGATRRLCARQEKEFTRKHEREYMRRTDRLVPMFY